MGYSEIATVFLLLGLSFQVYGELSEVIEKCLKVSSKCATLPAECLSNSTNCIAAAYISTIGNDTYQIDYSALNNYQYISFGFSHDQRMGEDVVVDCIMDAVGKVNIYSAYNVGYKHYLEVTQNEALKYVSSGIYDGIYCKFQITGQLKVGEYTGPEIGEPTYILLALGQTKDGKPIQHELAAISNEIHLNSSKTNTGTSLAMLMAFISYFYF